MKRLCLGAGVAPTKVFPHNLRHLFARTFYQATRDVAKLADVLGHSSIETTRIYLISTGAQHRPGSGPPAPRLLDKINILHPATRKGRRRLHRFLVDYSTGRWKIQAGAAKFAQRPAI